VRGEKGDQGATGAPGLLPIVKDYTPGAVHYAGVVVAHAGGLFQALLDTARAPPSDDWICLAHAGADGADGATPNILGTYDPTAAYNKYDVVALNGSSFIARKNNASECPGNDWQLIASAGKTGIKGPPGDKGERGSPGPQGEPAPLVIAWRVDRKTYTVQPMMSDGSEVLPINMRELFEQYADESR
jgi:hypothetical protein